MPQHKTQEIENPEASGLSTTSFPTPLSPHWAFVVQLRHGTPLTPEQMQERVEHIVSGQATLFASLSELCVFLKQVLSQTREKPP